ncbi:MAG: YigZ family protein [Acidobacteria bacterium]|nr:YigZ family protein [Acidobacteriota bacterium]
MLTLARDSQTEALIQKSRFVSLAFRADSEDAFRRQLEEIRRRFPGANHYVFAYVIREADGRQCIRFSDDGEPHNSAGRPVLAPIQGRDLTNAAVVVVRYFGGIKLGVGGLVRAYGGGASSALDVAGIRPLTRRESGSLVLDYAALPEAERRLKAEGAEIVRKEFGEKVTLFFEKEIV